MTWNLDGIDICFKKCRGAFSNFSRGWPQIDCLQTATENKAIAVVKKEKLTKKWMMKTG